MKKIFIALILALSFSLSLLPSFHQTYAACKADGDTTCRSNPECCSNNCNGATSFGPGTCKAAPTPAPPPKCPNGSPGIPDGGDCPVKDLNGTDLNCCTTNAKCVKAGVDPQTRCIPPAGACTLTGNCSSDGDCCSPNKCLPDTSKPGFNVNTCQSPTQLENPGPPPSPPCTSYSNGQCATVKSSLGDLSTDPGQFISKIFGFLIAIGGGIALLLIIRAGYRLMTSRGNPEGVQQGREQLIAAIVGLLFLIFSFVILEVIGVDILKIPNIGGSPGVGTSACSACMTASACVGSGGTLMRQPCSNNPGLEKCSCPIAPPACSACMTASACVGSGGTLMRQPCSTPGLERCSCP